MSNKKRSKSFHISFYPHEFELIEAVAEKKFMSKTELIREAIRRYIQELEQGKPVNIEPFIQKLQNISIDTTKLEEYQIKQHIETKEFQDTILDQFNLLIAESETNIEKLVNTIKTVFELKDKTFTWQHFAKLSGLGDVAMTQLLNSGILILDIKTEKLRVAKFEK